MPQKSAARGLLDGGLVIVPDVTKSLFFKPWPIAWRTLGTYSLPRVPGLSGASKIPGAQNQVALNLYGRSFPNRLAALGDEGGTRAAREPHRGTNRWKGGGYTRNCVGFWARVKQKVRTNCRHKPGQ